MPSFLFVIGVLLACIGRQLAPLQSPPTTFAPIAEVYRSPEDAHQLILEQLGVVDLPPAPEPEILDLTDEAEEFSILLIEPAPDPIYH